jgi:hypothetical protein
MTKSGHVSHPPPRVPSPPPAASASAADGLERAREMARAPPTFTRICPGPGSGIGTSRSSGGFCQATSWNALTPASSVAYPIDVHHLLTRTSTDLPSENFRSSFRP